jgi:hypothetical protein
LRRKPSVKFRLLTATWNQFQKLAMLDYFEEEEGEGRSRSRRRRRRRKMRRWRRRQRRR